MTHPVAYLDSSAIVKLIVAEEGSAGLRGWVRHQARIATCAIARTEVLRAVRHVGPDALGLAHRALAELDMIAVDDRLLDTAAVLDPAVLRSLDAIHLAAALSLGPDLGAVVSYDARMLDGARILGLLTARPT